MGVSFSITTGAIDLQNAICTSCGAFKILDMAAPYAVQCIEEEMRRDSCPQSVIDEELADIRGQIKEMRSAHLRLIKDYDRLYDAICDKLDECGLESYDED